MRKPDKVFGKLVRGDNLTNKELVYARNLLDEALHLGVLLGTSGDMLRRWAATDLYSVEGYLKNRGVKYGGHQCAVLPGSCGGVEGIRRGSNLDGRRGEPRLVDLAGWSAHKAVVGVHRL